MQNKMPFASDFDKPQENFSAIKYIDLFELAFSGLAILDRTFIRDHNFLFYFHKGTWLAHWYYIGWSIAGSYM